MRRTWAKGRIEAFSDGIFAIAITLLVLDIGVPEDGTGDLLAALVDQWPDYLAYATSFITIGGLWLAHHGIFSRLEAVHGAVLRLNLALLMLVAFLPFPTRLMAQAIEEVDAERVAVIFYGLTLLAISCTFTLLWHVATRSRDLVSAEVSDEEVRAVRLAVAPNIGLYAGTVLLALVAPTAAAFAFLAIAAIAVFRARPDTAASSRLGD